MKRISAEEQYFGLALALGAVAFSVALGLYGYLGIFSRYSSDDYCLSAYFLKGEFVNIMSQRYFNASNRYTNILFIGLVDRIFGWYNVAILPPLMLILFALGLYLLLKEIGQALSLGWSSRMICFMAVSIAFFSILQTPDLYQTLYWRAGMTSHFAPLVFIPFIGAFVLRQIRLARERKPSLWVQFVCFVAPFIVGGFSEPPTTLMITILVLALFAVWWWGDVESRRSSLILLTWSLMGALAALAVLAFAPANSLRLQTPPPGLLELISRIFQYPFEFILDSFKTLPTPMLVSVALPAVLFYARSSDPSQELSDDTRKRLAFLTVVVPLLAYVLIAASFAPSAYGQSYPVARARFIGRLLMTGALMMEGALSGILLANARTDFVRSISFRRLAIPALMLISFYPLRTAWQLSAEIPAYRQAAKAWDARDAQIRALKAEGVQDLVVPFLPQDPIQDLGDYTEFRLNRCASALYGVHSILALPEEE